jgi:type 1 glutamine amidotransferase
MSDDRVQLLLVTKGHPYDRGAFMNLFDSDPSVATTCVEQPAAQVILRTENLGAYDAVLFYDMQGIAIPGPGVTEPLGAFLDPPPSYVRSIEALLERGTGIVMLNHATLQWPAWPLWREVSGSSFMVAAGELAGKPAPASGFRGGMMEPDRNVAMRVEPASSGHPVLRGLEQGFEIRDEVYLKSDRMGARVLPLLRADYDFIDANFALPATAPAEERASWSHPPGTDVIAWANAVGSSPVVATDLGDGPDAYANPGFRRLVHNAIHWVASPEAREWARARR